MRRATGAGTIERYRGRFRARAPDAKRTPIGVFDTAEDAERALDAHFAIAVAPRGETLRTYGERWLDARERAGYRGIEQDVRHWRASVAKWSCYEWPLRELKRGDVRRWVDGLARGHADQTARNPLNLVRVCLRSAVDDGVIPSNPADGVRVHSRGHVEDTWTYLTVPEQHGVLACEAIPIRIRMLIQFAIGTGLRWGEQRVLELVDVHLDSKLPYVHVRRSKRGAPKNTKHRSVPLFGMGLKAAQWLVADSTSRSNRRGLLCVPEHASIYPAGEGPRRNARAEEIRAGKYARGDKVSYLEDAGIERRVRWHDLRHTCGSSLVAGWWGRAWTLLEVRDFLGHQTITTTERYAHLAGSVVETAARETAAALAGAITAPSPTAEVIELAGRKRP
jgi:integrase